jgi:hypothetical protein
MARATQFPIGWCMIAIIGYFCAFPELAVLLGIFAASLLFVSPVLVLSYFALRFSLRIHRPADPPPVGNHGASRLSARAVSVPIDAITHVRVVISWKCRVQPRVREHATQPSEVFVLCQCSEMVRRQGFQTLF